jgi:transposase
MKDIIVTDIDKSPEFTTIHIESLRRYHHCPCCHQQTDTVHNYLIQTVIDIPILGTYTLFCYRQRIMSIKSISVF